MSEKTVEYQGYKGQCDLFVNEWKTIEEYSSLVAYAILDALVVTASMSVSVLPGKKKDYKAIQRILNSGGVYGHQSFGILKYDLLESRDALGVSRFMIRDTQQSKALRNQIALTGSIV